MELQNNYMEDIINRYIYQVTKHIPLQTRRDINEELRTLIDDMLEDKTHDNPPTKEDIHSILKELGSPSDLAEKYRDKSRFLIGPEIFPVYLLIMKIVLGATLLGMSIVTVLDLLTSSHVIWYEYLGSLFGNLTAGLFMAFSWVTVIFAIFEWRGVNLKELVPEWEVSSLPPIPTKEETIPISGPIASIIFTILGMIILHSAPQLLGVYYFSDTMNTVSVFDLVVLQTVLPLFLICMGLELMKSIWEIVDRRYSIKFAVFTFVVNLIEVTLTIIIFTRFPIWNKNFIPELTALYDLGSDLTIASIWNMVTANLITIIVLIYLLDTATTIYKSLKNENKFIFNK